MIDGKSFKAGKAYKDSKLCSMIISRELHRRFHADTGIGFTRSIPASSPKPRCSATRQSCSSASSPGSKNITKGYVSQPLSGERVAQVVADPEFQISGVHWSLGNRQKPGAKPFAQPLSAQARNDRRSSRLWELGETLTVLWR